MVMFILNIYMNSFDKYDRCGYKFNSQDLSLFH